MSCSEIMNTPEDIPEVTKICLKKIVLFGDVKQTFFGT